ncbi:MAG: hypothetical protein AVDCRST_MAG73-1063, partial [uncultured Thermomicrobiales bacterium]
ADVAVAGQGAVGHVRASASVCGVFGLVVDRGVLGPPGAGGDGGLVRDDRPAPPDEPAGLAGRVRDRPAQPRQGVAAGGGAAAAAAGVGLEPLVLPRARQPVWGLGPGLVRLFGLDGLRPAGDVRGGRSVGTADRGDLEAGSGRGDAVAVPVAGVDPDRVPDDRLGHGAGGAADFLRPGDAGGDRQPGGAVRPGDQGLRPAGADAGAGGRAGVVGEAEVAVRAV